MIAIGAVLTCALLFMAWRRAAWSVALLGIAVGISASGPIATGVKAGIHAATTLANSVNHLV